MHVDELNLKFSLSATKYGYPFLAWPYIFLYVYESDAFMCTHFIHCLFSSRDCQVKDWCVHKLMCSEANSTSETCQNHQHVHRGDSEDSILTSSDRAPDCQVNAGIKDAGVTIKVKANKSKLTLNIGEHFTGEGIMTAIASRTRIPVDKMKVIHKGRLMNAENVMAVIKPNALFQVIGETMENEDGLESHDIDVVKQQAGVERNNAIRALRAVNGDVIEAILYLGNK